MKVSIPSTRGQELEAERKENRTSDCTVIGQIL